MQAKTPIKVIIIDDNKRIRFIIQETLKPEADILVCGEAGTLPEAKEALSILSPDVAVLDISLEESEGGLKFLREVSEKGVATSFVVLSSHNAEIYAERSFAAGAKAYLSKDKTVQHLAEAIRCVHKGKKFIPAEV